MKDFDRTLAAAQEVAKEKKEALSNFETWNVSCYEMSRDKQRKADPSAIEAPAIEAEPVVLAQSSPFRMGLCGRRAAPSPGSAQKPV